MTNDLNNTLGRPDLAPATKQSFSKRTKLLFMGFAAVCIAAITQLI